MGRLGLCKEWSQSRSHMGLCVLNGSEGAQAIGQRDDWQRISFESRQECRWALAVGSRVLRCTYPGSTTEGGVKEGLATPNAQGAIG